MLLTNLLGVKLLLTNTINKNNYYIITVLSTCKSMMFAGGN